MQKKYTSLASMKDIDEVIARLYSIQNELWRYLHDSRYQKHSEEWNLENIFIIQDLQKQWLSKEGRDVLLWCVQEMDKIKSRPGVEYIYRQAKETIAMSIVVSTDIGADELPQYKDLIDTICKNELSEQDIDSKDTSARQDVILDLVESVSDQICRHNGIADNFRSTVFSDLRKVIDKSDALAVSIFTRVGIANSIPMIKLGFLSPPTIKMLMNPNMKHTHAHPGHFTTDDYFDWLLVAVCFGKENLDSLSVYIENADWLNLVDGFYEAGGQSPELERLAQNSANRIADISDDALEKIYRSIPKNNSSLVWIREIIESAIPEKSLKADSISSSLIAATLE